MPPKKSPPKDKKVPKGSHKMTDGKVMKDSDMPKKKTEVKQSNPIGKKKDDRDPVVVKGLKDGKITQNQFDKLSDGLLKGIVKKGGNGAKKK